MVDDVIDGEELEVGIRRKGEPAVQQHPGVPELRDLVGARGRESKRVRRDEHARGAEGHSHQQGVDQRGRPPQQPRRPGGERPQPSQRHRRQGQHRPHGEQAGPQPEAEVPDSHTGAIRRERRQRIDADGDQGQPRDDAQRRYPPVEPAPSCHRVRPRRSATNTLPSAACMAGATGPNRTVSTSPAAIAHSSVWP